MKLVTEYAGDVEYSKEETIAFPEGIFGFPNSREFIIIGEMTEDFPFVWLQSTSEKDVHFILTNPFLFVNDYDFVLKDDFVDKVSVKNVSEVEVLCMVIVPEDIQETTVNLKSPLIFNVAERIAKQAVLDEDYPFRHKLFVNSREDNQC